MTPEQRASRVGLAVTILDGTTAIARAVRRAKSNGVDVERVEASLRDMEDWAKEVLK